MNPKEAVEENEREFQEALKAVFDIDDSSWRSMSNPLYEMGFSPHQLEAVLRFAARCYLLGKRKGGEEKTKTAWHDFWC